MSLSLFLIRGERAASEAESCVLGAAGGREHRAAVQLFHHCKPNAMVLPKSWGTPHQPVLQSFRNKAEWKTEVHNSHSGTPQLFVHFLLSDHRLRHLFLCCGSTVLPTHLQPVHKPSVGWVWPFPVTRHQDAPQNICLVQCIGRVSL